MARKLNIAEQRAFAEALLFQGVSPTFEDDILLRELMETVSEPASLPGEVEDLPPFDWKLKGHGL